MLVKMREELYDMRKATTGDRAMAMQAQGAEVIEFERPSATKLRAIAAELDFSKPLKWDSLDKLSEFYALCERSPLHSVVAKIWPVVAYKLL